MTKRQNSYSISQQTTRCRHERHDTLQTGVTVGALNYPIDNWQRKSCQSSEKSFNHADHHCRLSPNPLHFVAKYFFFVDYKYLYATCHNSLLKKLNGCDGQTIVEGILSPHTDVSRNPSLEQPTDVVTGLLISGALHEFSSVEDDFSIECDIIGDSARSYPNLCAKVLTFTCRHLCQQRDSDEFFRMILLVALCCWVYRNKHERYGMKKLLHFIMFFSHIRLMERSKSYGSSVYKLN